jgi:T5SS/PEP-CTERM-associated repeat protein
MQCRTPLLLCVPIVLGLLAATAVAQTLTWDGGGDGNDWFDSLNWNPNGDPTDDANRIVLSGAPVASRTVSADYGGAISITGAGWATFEDELYIGANSTGIFAVADGGRVSSCWTYIGGYSGDGTATLDGADSMWTNTGNLDVAYLGNGTLAITGCGSVSNENGYIGSGDHSTGVVTVDGNGLDGTSSTWTNNGNLYVGGSASAAGGTGTVTVSNSGVLEVGRTLRVWDAGTVNLDAGGRVVAEEVALSDTGSPQFITTAGSTLRVNTLTGFGDVVSLNGSLQIGHASSGSGSHTVGAGQSLTVRGAVRRLRRQRHAGHQGRRQRFERVRFPGVRGRLDGHGDGGRRRLVLGQRRHDDCRRLRHRAVDGNGRGDGELL